MSVSGIVVTRGPIDEALGRRAVRLFVEPLMGLLRARPLAVARVLVVVGAGLVLLVAIGQPLAVAMPGTRKVGYAATALLPALLVLALVFWQAKRMETASATDGGSGCGLIGSAVHDCAKRFARVRAEVAVPFLVVVPTFVSGEETAYGAMYAYVKMVGLLVCGVALFAATTLMEPPERGCGLAPRPVVVRTAGRR